VSCLRKLCSIYHFLSPLNSIGLPYYSEHLLSAYDKHFQSVPEHFPPPMKIPPQILASLKQVDGLAFAQMPRELQGKRNVLSVAGTKRQGRFRSDKSRRHARVCLINQLLNGKLIFAVSFARDSYRTTARGSNSTVLSTGGDRVLQVWSGRL